MTIKNIARNRLATDYTAVSKQSAMTMVTPFTLAASIPERGTLHLLQEAITEGLLRFIIEEEIYEIQHGMLVYKGRLEHSNTTQVLNGL